MKLEEYALTTTDNPYDPYTQFDEWIAMDRQLGHYTCEYLARICENISYELSQEEQNALICEAIDKIIANDPFEIYTKAYAPKDYSPLEQKGLNPDDFEGL